jgi:hypothetical protein
MIYENLSLKKNLMSKGTTSTLWSTVKKVVHYRKFLFSILKNFLNFHVDLISN